MAEEGTKHLTIKVFGRVQGVLFRHMAKKMADEIGIFGYVKNLNDGSVLIEVEGSDEALRKFVDWCKGGPQEARVDKVEIEDMRRAHYEDFRIF
jgi:acylphosphatase